MLYAYCLGDKRLDRAVSVIRTGAPIEVVARTLGYRSSEAARNYLRKHKIYKLWKNRKRYVERKERQKKIVKPTLKNAFLHKDPVVARKTRDILREARRIGLSVRIGNRMDQCRIEGLPIRVYPVRKKVRHVAGPMCYHFQAGRNDKLGIALLPEGGRAFMIPGVRKSMNMHQQRNILEGNWERVEPWPDKELLRRVAAIRNRAIQNGLLGPDPNLRKARRNTAAMPPGEKSSP